MSAAEQLGFDNMPRRLVRATPTRLTGWLDCPRRYRFTYLERPTPQKGPPWAHTSMGAAVHTALANWWRLPVARRTPEAAGALLISGWLTDGFRDRGQSERWRELAREMVEDYAAGLDPSDEPIGVERTVALRTPVLALSGRADRIDERLAVPFDDADDADAWPQPRAGAAGAGEGGGPSVAGPSAAGPGCGAAGRPSAGATTSAAEPQPVELVIVDYKTGRYAPNTDDARGSLALAVYAAAAQATLRRPCHRVELHHLPTRTVVSWQHTDQSLTRHLSRANAIGEEVAEAEAAYPTLRGDDLDTIFPPRPGPQCRWCDFAAHCPQGREAYPRRRSWEGLSTEETAAAASPGSLGSAGSNG